MAVYVLELETPLGSERHSARYYVGWTRDETTLDARLRCHACGKGARMLAAAAARGIGWRVVWFDPEGDRALEKAIKRQRNTRRWLAQQQKNKQQTKEKLS